MAEKLNAEQIARIIARVVSEGLANAGVPLRVGPDAKPVQDATADILALGEGERPKLLAYEHAHETAIELGYPSLTEALEELADLRSRLSAAEALVKALREGLELAVPIVEYELGCLLSSYCHPPKAGADYDPETIEERRAYDHARQYRAFLDRAAQLLKEGG